MHDISGHVDFFVLDSLSRGDAIRAARDFHASHHTGITILEHCNDLDRTVTIILSLDGGS